MKKEEINSLKKKCRIFLTEVLTKHEGVTSLREQERNEDRKQRSHKEFCPPSVGEFDEEEVLKRKLWYFLKKKKTNKLILLNTSNKQKTFASFLYSINCLQMKMEVLSVQNQYPAHFALATGKFRKSSPFKKNFSSPT